MVNLAPSFLTMSDVVEAKRTYSTVPIILSVTVITQRMLGSSVVKCVTVELFVLQLEISMNSIKALKILRVVTSSKMSWPEAELKCVLEESMEQYVMTCGT